MVRCMHGYLGGGQSRISKLNHEDHKLSSQDRAKKKSRASLEIHLEDSKGPGGR